MADVLLAAGANVNARNQVTIRCGHLLLLTLPVLGALLVVHDIEMNGADLVWVQLLVVGEDLGDRVVLEDHVSRAAHRTRACMHTYGRVWI